MPTLTLTTATWAKRAEFLLVRKRRNPDKTVVALNGQMSLWGDALGDLSRLQTAGVNP